MYVAFFGDDHNFIVMLMMSMRGTYIRGQKPVYPSKQVDPGDGGLTPENIWQQK
jgi:hypothetical protein